MALISDNSQDNRLKNFDVNIKTKYIVGSKILERNTNGNSDDIEKGVICEKQYFWRDKLLLSEKQFDTRMEYTFVFKNKGEEEYTCPNCGVHLKLNEFKDGCPYCKANYNLDYTQKDLGGKYHYDLVLRSTKYRVITAFVDIIICLIISYLLIINTSRTFNSIDIAKIFIYAGILSLVLYYLFYTIDAYVILGPIQRYKNAQNDKQIEFWKRTQLDKSKFFNSLNYEIRKKYYSSSNIIDYDILDFDEFKEFYKDNIMYVAVKAYVRIVYFKNGKISSKYQDESYVLRRNNSEKIVLKNGVNLIKCKNCGASIDATKGKCEYCLSPIDDYEDWIIL